jgi:hypothetical protein
MADTMTERLRHSSRERWETPREWRAMPREWRAMLRERPVPPRAGVP